MKRNWILATLSLILAVVLGSCGDNEPEPKKVFELPYMKWYADINTLKSALGDVKMEDSDFFPEATKTTVYGLNNVIYQYYTTKQRLADDFDPLGFYKVSVYVPMDQVSQDELLAYVQSLCLNDMRIYNQHFGNEYTGMTKDKLSNISLLIPSDNKYTKYYSIIFSDKHFVNARDETDVVP
ncbi:MAG: hypothetical protein MJZ74_03970 [Muribaculaceae bacterium]|nr:hypothetical protein [Muribaculaceae bacterium]